MLVGASCTQGAVPLDKGFAYWSVGIETEVVCLEQEGGEREVVLGRLMFENLAREIGRSRTA